MKRIFAFCNQKGGVGKTTSAVNIATLVAGKGYRTLLVDMDAQGNATSGVGVEKNNLESTAYQLLVDNYPVEKVLISTEIKNLDLLPANTDLSGADLELVQKERREFVLSDKLKEVQDQYDFIFIDSPPSLGLMSINCLVSSNYIIIPLQCEYYSLEGLGQLLNTFQLVQTNLNEKLDIGGVILTMADFRTNLTQQVIEEVRNYFHDKVFQNVIPRSVKLSEAPSFGKPAVLYDPHNKGSKSYEALLNEFLARFEGKNQPQVPSGNQEGGAVDAAPAVEQQEEKA